MKVAFPSFKILKFSGGGFPQTPPYTLAPSPLACEPPQFKIRSAIPVNCNITQFEKNGQGVAVIRISTMGARKK